MKRQVSQKTWNKIADTSKRYANQMGYSKKQPLKEMTMRDMLRITREKQMKEEALASSEPVEKQLTPAEQEAQQRSMQTYFDNDNINIRFEPILLYDSGVFWAGTIDGQLKFAYVVTPDESSSGVKIERSPDFDPNNEDNQKIEKKIIDYYDTFYDYWSENQLEN
jgi:hypothetical protein